MANLELGEGYEVLFLISLPLPSPSFPFLLQPSPYLPSLPFPSPTFPLPWPSSRPSPSLPLEIDSLRLDPRNWRYINHVIIIIIIIIINLARRSESNVSFPRGVWTGAQTVIEFAEVKVKQDLTSHQTHYRWYRDLHFIFKIWHLVATISMIFLRINLP